MNDAADFTKLVPGFDFLQNLAKTAGSALPGIGQWVAPTLDPDEIDKRIKELRTVQFWLEQNVRMLATTIQALEVQRMTLSTLKTMNVQMTDLRDSLKIKPSPAAPSVDAAPAPVAATAATAAPASRAAGKAKAKGATAPGSVVDPMQWWGALTNQFAQLATTALKDTSTDAAKTLGGTLLKQSLDSASTAFKAALPKASADPGPTRRKSPRRRAATKR
ncbi:MAG: PhaM family polyhydroxyalkanoate granule multifunctional regulatory protein [Caldimonas sp.]